MLYSLFFFFAKTGTPSPIRTGPNVNKYTIGNLAPYTLYKIVMSVETRLGEGQSSTPLLNRTGEGRTLWPSWLLLLNIYCAHY